MRSVVMGFKQEELVKYKMDIVDTMILKYFVDFKKSGRMLNEEFCGETYYWVTYEKIALDLPMLYMKKDSVYRRMKRMAEINILKRYTKKSGGTYSFYTIGEVYDNLLAYPSSDKNTEGYGQDSKEVMDKNTEGYGKKVVTKIDKLENSTNNNKYRKDIEIIMDYFDRATGKNFKLYDKQGALALEALFNEGYSVKQIIAVINLKVEQWKGTKIECYIRPKTLFGEKFTGYLAEAINAEENNKCGFKDYSYDELEESLIEWYQ